MEKKYFNLRGFGGAVVRGFGVVVGLRVVVAGRLVGFRYL